MVKRCSAQGWCLKDSDFLSPASRASILVKNPRAYARGYYLPPLRGSLMLIPYEHLGMGKKIKVDMSAAAVTARLKRACGLGEAQKQEEKQGCEHSFLVINSPPRHRYQMRSLY